MKLSLLILISFLVSSCVFFYPKQKDERANCETITKEYVVESNGVVFNILEGCSDEACVIVLLSSLGISASTFVVSGSFALVGNTLNWAERTAKCDTSEWKPNFNEDYEKPRRNYQK